MNREIKFRAFIAGVMKPIAILHNTPHPARVLDMDFDTNHVNATLFPVETPVMQYTGLKDAKGIEIYEGDILLSVFSDGTLDINDYSIVSFKDGSFMDGELGLWETYEESLVAGNIHENPELLK